ncbi:hypothetical protein QBC43DRAFT_294121 [Cladorrhinum sp. PSN259]|nr:hypothetical protein QBC43DRAFT_294121 [Cladorrhinum sp. PSN259]
MAKELEQKRQDSKGAVKQAFENTQKALKRLEDLRHRAPVKLGKTGSGTSSLSSGHSSASIMPPHPMMGAPSAAMGRAPAMGPPPSMMSPPTGMGHQKPYGMAPSAMQHSNTHFPQPYGQLAPGAVSQQSPYSPYPAHQQHYDQYSARSDDMSEVESESSGQQTPRPAGFGQGSIISSGYSARVDASQRYASSAVGRDVMDNDPDVDTSDSVSQVSTTSGRAGGSHAGFQAWGPQVGSQAWGPQAGTSQSRNSDVSRSRADRYNGWYEAGSEVSISQSGSPSTLSGSSSSTGFSSTGSSRTGYSSTGVSQAGRSRASRHGVGRTEGAAAFDAARAEARSMRRLPPNVASSYLGNQVERLKAAGVYHRGYPVE